MPGGIVEQIHPSTFTRRKAVIRIIQDVRKAWFSDTLRAGFAIAHTAPFRKSAFTLAEVLITLGIIGVVAAMTLPALTANNRKAEATARLKKFNSSMQQAIRMSELKNGPCLDWEYEKIGDYDIEENAAQNYETSQAFVEKYLTPFMKLKSGKKEWVTSKDQKLEGYSLVLADGSVMNAKVGDCVDISIDINGEKKPNQKGIDQFIFLLCKRGEERIPDRCFTSYSYKNRSFNTREKRLEGCKSNPYYCSGLLEWDNWEFKDDYPYKL